MKSNSLYKHFDKEENFFSLHDCCAESVSFKDGVLTFYFENGFWVTPNHTSSTFEQTVRTDFAEVKFILEQGDKSDILIYVFSKKMFGKIIREEWTLDTLVDAINNKKCKLEFLYQYKGFNDQMVDCWLRFNRYPYNKECQLKISLSEVIYCWNDLCSDKMW